MVTAITRHNFSIFSSIVSTCLIPERSPSGPGIPCYSSEIIRRVWLQEPDDVFEEQQLLSTTNSSRWMWAKTSYSRDGLPSWWVCLRIVLFEIQHRIESTSRSTFPKIFGIYRNDNRKDIDIVKQWTFFLGNYIFQRWVHNMQSCWLYTCSGVTSIKIEGERENFSWTIKEERNVGKLTKIYILAIFMLKIIKSDLILTYLPLFWRGILGTG